MPLIQNHAEVNSLSCLCIYRSFYSSNCYGNPPQMVPCLHSSYTSCNGPVSPNTLLSVNNPRSLSTSLTFNIPRKKRLKQVYGKNLQLFNERKCTLCLKLEDECNFRLECPL